MMRPVQVALPPLKADGLTWIITGSGNNRRFTIGWNDNSITETAFVLQRSVDGTTWANVGTSASPLDQPNTHGTRSLRDATSDVGTPYLYRVVAQNTVGYGGAYPSVTVQSTSDPIIAGTPPTSAPLPPTNLAVTLVSGPQARLTWRDNATNESGFVIERALAGSTTWELVGTAPARNSTGNVTFSDPTIQGGVNYDYRVAAVNLFGGQVTLSAYAGPVTTTGAAAMPAAPTNFTAANGPDAGKKRTVILNWTDNATNETGFTVQRATNAAFTTGLVTTSVAANATQLTVTGLNRATTYYFRIQSLNGITTSAWVQAAPFPIITNP